MCENPFKHKKRTKSRGDSWDEVAESLISSGINMQLTGKIVRSRFETLRSKFIARMNVENRGSGITAEHGEYEQLMQDLIDMERDEISIMKEKTEEEKENMEKAEGIRKRCLKRMKEKEEEEPRKKRKENATLEYLREKNERTMELKEKELKIREQELELERSVREKEGSMMKEQLVELSKRIEGQTMTFQNCFLEMQKQQMEIMKMILSKSEK